MGDSNDLVSAITIRTIPNLSVDVYNTTSRSAEASSGRRLGPPGAQRLRYSHPLLREQTAGWQPRDVTDLPSSFASVH